MSDPLVTVREGTLRGRSTSDLDGKHFFSFQGIPYAKPPLGKLRFKAPQAPEKWEGIRDALEEGDDCYAKHGTGVFFGSEDCLFLNVFTRQITVTSLKPVMFWIHAGAFTSGSSRTFLYGPEYLMTQDIVLVTINYRLGVLGFLNLEDSSVGVPGNAGLKDVVMALKWVQQNIEKFGGDPHNVTIFGESAGGAVVHLLMLSPMGKGLFHKAIAQSGCAMNGWARGKKVGAYLLAEKLGIESNDDKTILEHLQEMSVDELCKASCSFIDSFYVGNIRLYGPVIERKGSTEPAFLTEDPIAVLKSGNYHKVPFLMGYCSREGMYLYSLCVNTKGNHVLVDETVVPYMMNLRIGSTLYKFVCDSIRQFYFKEKEPLSNVDDIYRLYTDNFFLLGIYNSARIHLKTSSTPVYFYKFSLSTTRNVMKVLCSFKEPGACHTDDVPYLFKNSLTPDDVITQTSPEGVGIRRMTKMWANFAKYGNPTPDIDDKLLGVTWEPMKPNEFNYLEIGDQLETKLDPEKPAMDFWNDLFSSLKKRVAKL